MMANLLQSHLSAIENFDGFVRSAHEPNSIDTYLSMVSKMPHRIFIRQFMIFHKKDILHAIDKQAWRFSVFESLNPNFPVFRVSQQRKADDNIGGTIVVLPGTFENISRVITVSDSDYWDKLIRRKLVRHFYPDAMPIYFRQQEIEDALETLDLSLSDGYSLQISEVTSKEMRTGSQSTRKKTYDTRRLWTSTLWREPFIEAKEKGEWFTGLKFSIQRGKSSDPVAVGRIYKYGEVHYDFYHEKILNTVLFSLENNASQRLSLLQNRGIRERNYQPGESLEISFDYDPFANIEDIRAFGKIMASYPNATKAVYHANPYYHASIADFDDGSSFDMWILSKSKIVIVPQAKSSVQAFERLISYVFTELGEGIVNVYKESETE